MLDFYGLHTDPFSVNPDLDFLYLSSAHQEAIAHLVYGIEKEESLILIAGDIGTGKTLALNRLVSQIPKVFVPVVLNVTTIEFQECLRLLVLKLECEHRSDMGTAELLNTLENKFVELSRSRKKVLVIIDEAQNLNVKTLEGMRLLLNICPPGRQALHLVLAGQLGLIDKLRLPELRQLRQRIRVECKLGYLSRQEMEEYIVHRLKMAGRTKPLFDRNALDRIFQLSSGVPRLVNVLAGRAILAGYVDGAKKIGLRHIEIEDDGTQALGPLENQLEGRVSTGENPSRHPVVSSRVHGEDADTPPAARIHSGSTHAVSRGYGSDSRSRGRRWFRWVFPIVLLLLALAVAANSLTREVDLWGALRSWVPLLQRPPVASSDTTALPVSADPEVSLPTGEDVRPAGRPQGVALAETLGVTAEAVPESKASFQVSGPAAAQTDTITEMGSQTLYFVHVASFADADRAEWYIASLQEKGFQAFSRTAQLGPDQSWHRVFLGPFYDRESAEVLITALKKLNIIQYAQIEMEEN